VQARQAGRTDRQGTRQTERTTREGDRQSQRTDRQGNRQDFANEARDDRYDARDDAREDWSEAAGDNWEGGWGGDDWEYPVGAGLAVGAAVAVGTAITASAFNAMACPAPVVVNGAYYYNCNGGWYSRAYQGGSVQYMAVPPPPGY
jgi:hypothetical protein